MRIIKKFIVLFITICFIISTIPLKLEAASSLKIVNIKDIVLTVQQNTKINLPKTVSAVYSDKSTKNVPVIWNAALITSKKISKYPILGVVKDYSKKVTCIINVVEGIKALKNIQVSVNRFDQYKLPKTTEVIMSDGIKKQLPVSWYPEIVDTKTIGLKKYIGTINGYNENFVLSLTVNNKELEPWKISEMNEKAVFYIEVYDKNNKMTGSGTGFFIDKAGTAITNYHVLDKANSAKIFLVDGRSFEIRSIIGYSKKLDILMFKVEGNNFNYVSLGNSDSIKNGQKIFTIGCPQGLENTISDGLISNKSRRVDNNTYIQISAPISHGSSGGVLLDIYGDVIGITSAYITDGQNLNLAIPINYYKIIYAYRNLTFNQFYTEEHVVKLSNGTYEGDLKDGAFNGFGVFKWNDGFTYIGNWSNGKMNGYGEHFDKDGTYIYKGDFVNGLKQGKGIVSLSDGYVYEGDFSEGKYNGKGAQKWGNGDKFVGEFKDGLREGNGIYYWAAGSRLEGSYKNGKADGYCIYYYGDGRTKSGYWSQGTYAGNNSSNTAVVTTPQPTPQPVPSQSAVTNKPDYTSYQTDLNSLKAQYEYTLLLLNQAEKDEIAAMERGFVKNGLIGQAPANALISEKKASYELLRQMLASEYQNNISALKQKYNIP